MGQQKNRGIIGILTGGGDVPGLNPAIRAVTIRALREGYKVIGIQRGLPDPYRGRRHVELRGTLEQGKSESRGYSQNHGQRCSRNRLLYWFQHLYYPHDCPHT